MQALFGVLFLVVAALGLCAFYLYRRRIHIQRIAIRHLNLMKAEGREDYFTGPLSALIDAGAFRLRGRWELESVRRRILRLGLEDPGAVEGLPERDLYDFLRFMREHGLNVSSEKAAISALAAFKSAREVNKRRR